MKILAVGDFHGKVPRFLTKVVKKEKPDVILSPGDFCSFLEKKIWFRYCYGKDIALWEIIGKRRFNKYLQKNELNGEAVIKSLKSLSIPVYTITGNTDFTLHRDIGITREAKFRERPHPWTTDFLKKLKIPILDYSCKEFGEYNLIGYPMSSYPGFPTKAVIKKYEKLGKKKFAIKRRVRDYEKHRKKMLDILQSKRNIILVSHNCPYGLKMDIIREGHELAKGHHYGSILIRELILEKQPRLCICGHMHENQGKTKIGKTTVVNCGYGAKGEYAIIDLTPKRVRVKLKSA